MRNARLVRARRREGPSLGGILFLGAAIMGAWLAVASFPDLRRYLRIKKM